MFMFLLCISLSVLKSNHTFDTKNKPENARKKSRLRVGLLGPA